MDRKQFEMRYNFVPVFDTKMKKRRSIAPHLARNKAYLDKHEFILIEAPEAPPQPTYVNPPVNNITELVYANGIPGVFTEEDMKAEEIEQTIIEEKPKRGRPKKQS